MGSLTCIEICAGAGGQALGLEMSDFDPIAMVEIDKSCCNTLRYNRKTWNVIEDDLRNFDGSKYNNVDLLSGGVPCPPFSVAGKQLGKEDDRDLFPEAIRLVDEIRPQAVMLENVRGFIGAIFEDYRNNLKRQLNKLGYETDWRLLNASDFGVSQLRPRVVIIAIQKERSEYFSWPKSCGYNPPSVGEVLYELMASRGWKGAKEWMNIADDIAPTIVGGSKKHGGPDLGPTRAKRAWASLGVNAKLIANEPPGPDFIGMPNLTIDMVARLQGFPSEWHFTGKKTPAYRQVGNAFPPPVAYAVSKEIHKCLKHQKVFAFTG